MCSTTAKKQKILVVDDDLLALVTLTSGLLKAGYEVLEADNADDAILLAHHLHPDLAVLDLRLQARSGFDVAHYLREHMHTPFVFISAAADAATLACAQELGAAACLSKHPLDMGQILPTLRAAA